MVVRSKTRKRLALLLVVVTSLVAVAGGAYAYRKITKANETQQFRVDGMALYEQGKEFDAMHALGNYLWRSKTEDDIEAILLYADLREKIVEPDGISHLRSAAEMVRRVLVKTPGDVELKRRLMKLYADTFQTTEAVELADVFLAENPNDPDALWAKAISLQINTDQREHALELAKRYAELKPLDINGHTLVIQLMQLLDQPREDLLEYTNALLDRAPNDPVYNAVAARTGLLLKDADMAEKYADIAAALEPPDTDTVHTIATIYSSIYQFDKATDYLGKALEKFDDDYVRYRYLIRLWQSNQRARFLEVVENHEYNALQRNSNLIALHITTLYQYNRKDEAQSLIDKLNRRKDPDAEAWTILLAAGILDVPKPPVELIELCQQALVKSKQNPYILSSLAQGYREMGETELAVQTFSHAADLEVGWAEPLISAADILYELDQPRQALANAIEAHKRAPLNYKVGVMVAIGWSMQMDQLNTEFVEKLDILTTGLLKYNPNDRIVLPIRAKLLAHQGKTDQLRALYEQVLQADPPVETKALIELAGISHDEQLGYEEQLIAVAAAAEPNAPGVAYAQAIALAVDEKIEAGLEHLEAARAASTSPDSPQWTILQLRYKQRFTQIPVRDAWTRLADAHPENLTVQRAVLDEPLVWADRDLIDRSIERLKTISGERSMNWRIYRARWLMQNDVATDTAEAVKLLTDVIKVNPRRFDPHKLLAACYARQGNISGAISELEIALQIQPRDVPSLLELARLNIIQNNNRIAIDYINEAIAIAPDNLAFIRTGALFTVQAGQPRRAIEMLESTRVPDQPNIELDLLIANVYRGMRDYDRASQIYGSIPDEHLTPSAIEFIANHYRLEGQRDKALATLDKLEKTGVDPGITALIRGAYYVRDGQPEKAIELLDASLKAEPNQPLAWQMLITQHLQLSQVPRAVDAIRRAADACPDEQQIKLLYREIELVKALGDNYLCLPLFISVMNDAERSEPALQALRIIHEAIDTQMSQREIEVRIRRISDRYPSYMPARILVIRMLRTQGRIDEAAELAEKTMRAFPESIEVASLAAELYADAGMWRRTLATAREWRTRSEGREVEADMLIAQAAMRIDQPAQALRVTEPRIDGAMQDPAANEDIIFLHCQALFAADQDRKVAELLQPRLADSNVTRAIWLRLTPMAGADAEAAAQWVDRVLPFIADDPAEQVIVANAYFVIDKRFTTNTYAPRAIQMLTEMAEQQPAHADAVMLLAIILDSTDRDREAMKYYRLVIELDPERSVALNNLAMKLLDDPETLDEAFELAKRAVEISPASAEFQDTLGTIYLMKGDHQKAIEAMQIALQIQPRNVELAVHLGLAHVQAGQIDLAKRILDQIDQAVNNASRSLPSPVQKQLDTLREKVSG